MNEWETAEPWVPLPPEEEREPADEIECYCGTVWIPDLEKNCPSCGRMEAEQFMTDEELSDE